MEISEPDEFVRGSLVKLGELIPKPSFPSVALLDGIFIVLPNKKRKWKHAILDCVSLITRWITVNEPNYFFFSFPFVIIFPFLSCSLGWNPGQVITGSNKMSMPHLTTSRSLKMQENVALQTEQITNLSFLPVKYTINDRTIRTWLDGHEVILPQVLRCTTLETLLLKRLLFPYPQCCTIWCRACNSIYEYVLVKVHIYL